MNIEDRQAAALIPNHPTWQQRQTRSPTSIAPEPAVSGSESIDPNRQNPTESREILVPDLIVWGKYLPQQTQWRT